MYLLPFRLLLRWVSAVALAVLCHTLPAQPNAQPQVAEDLPVLRVVQLASHSISLKQMPVYRRSIYGHGIDLRCDYADYHLLNPAAWDTAAKGRKITEIDLVYTQYPLDTHAWRTPFTQLMSARLARLMAIDSAFRDPTIRFNLVAQTACKTEAEAKKLFHGFVVKYTVRLDDLEKKEPLLIQEQQFEITKKIIGAPDLKTGQIHTLFARHPEWQNLVVVLDWTASMYTHGAEFLNLYRHSLQKNLLRHMILFNDGDEYTRPDVLPNTPKPAKAIGRAGGIYDTAPQNLLDVINTLELCMMSGDGGEPDENDIEALLYAQAQFPDAKELLLIGDNSPIRDLQLLSRLHIPVRIIICDPFPDGGVYEQYIHLAWATGGGVYTRKQDLVFAAPADSLPPAGVEMLGQFYKLNPRTQRMERLPATAK